MALHVWMLLSACIAAAPGDEAGHSWRQAHSRVLPTGDIQWRPTPFVFKAGASARYIDFEAGDDGNPGTREQPWKHHPWDANAKGKAAACKGVHTYVFKQGVVYRGTLLATGAGRPGELIRLTRDPEWGEGEAVLTGAERVTQWRRGADHSDIPEPATS